jgi:predicted GIY-YIG superfamily endonuclease
MSFFYAYVLQSEAAPASFYVGFTENLRVRLKTHNSGQVSPPTAVDSIPLDSGWWTISLCQP